MPTTGGALAFEHLVPPYEATLTKNLRDAGAIIIAKTGMTELANYVTGGMPTNYNAVHGYGFNPYDPRRDPRKRRPSDPADRRLELRHRHRGELLGRQRRDRDVGFDPQPVEPEHARGGEADGRPHQPLRRHSDYRRPGHAGTDGEVRRGRRDHARRARRRAAGSERRGDEGRARRRPGNDYTKFLQRGRPEGGAHRHSAQELLRAVRPDGQARGTGSRGGRAADSIPRRRK